LTELPSDATGRTFTWPEGARLALSIVVNVEEGAERSVADGDSGLLAVSVENMVAMTDRTLPVSGSRTVNYSINIPEGIEGELYFSAKLRFRSFPPFYLRHLDLESLIGNVNIFNVDSLTQTLYVSSI